MSAITWPEGVRDHQLTGISQRQRENVVRSQMDSGPGKARRRFSAAPVDVDIPVEWPGSEYAVFRAWFDGTLASGALPFEWSDPATGGTVTMRFRETPAFRHIIPGSTSEQWWAGTLALEILP